MPNPPLDLSELRRLHEAATPGPLYLHTGAIGVNPWISAKGGECSNGDYVRGSCILNMVAHDRNEDDAALIVAAVNALPALLSRIEALEEENGRLRDAHRRSHMFSGASDADGNYVKLLFRSRDDREAFIDAHVATFTPPTNGGER